MNTLQKLGGAAALAHTAALAAGMILSFTLMYPLLEATPGQAQTWLADHQALAVLWTVFVDWGSASTVVVLALALYQRLSAGMPALALKSTACGLLWAGMIVVNSDLMLRNFGVVADFSGGDAAPTAAAWTALARSLWVLSVGLAALRGGGLPQPLGYLGLFLGVTGLLTLVPMVTEVMFMIFGPGMLVWSGWVGIDLLRPTRVEAPRQVAPFRPS